MLKYQGKKGKEQGYLKKQVQCGAAAPGLVGVRAPGEEVGERMGMCPGVWGNGESAQEGAAGIQETTPRGSGASLKLGSRSRGRPDTGCLVARCRVSPRAQELLWETLGLVSFLQDRGQHLAICFHSYFMRGE